MSVEAEVKRQTRTSQAEAGRNGAKKSAEGDRRRTTHPTTADKDYNGDETEFLQAMQRYKESTRRMFPTWSEALAVLKSLGYAKPETPRTDNPAEPQAGPTQPRTRRKWG